MKYTFKEKRKFKHIRRNIFDIPTGELDTPLTNGHEVLEFLMQVANKQRYQFKARGRGSRKVYGDVRDLPVEHAEKIALYHQTRDHIAEKEHQEQRRSKSAWEISYQLRHIKDAIEKHNNVFNNDLEINLEVNENE
mgnify:FL=1|tara:strand:+ start:647 stop:1054 length:408 start_codon:yes stop_codon:yes gene_type:complete